VDPVMFPRKNEPIKLQTKEYKLKTIYLHHIRMSTPRFLMLSIQ
jgi:hypothetical protein